MNIRKTFSHFQSRYPVTFSLFSSLYGIRGRAVQSHRLSLDSGLVKQFPSRKKDRHSLRHRFTACVLFQNKWRDEGGSKRGGGKSLSSVYAPESEVRPVFASVSPSLSVSRSYALALWHSPLRPCAPLSSSVVGRSILYVSAHNAGPTLTLVLQNQSCTSRYILNIWQRSSLYPGGSTPPCEYLNFPIFLGENVVFENNPHID